MFGLIPTEGYSIDFLIACGIAVLTLSFAIGCITDMVMRDSGFGPLGNGLLIALGGLAGLREQTQGWQSPVVETHFIWVIVVTACSAAAMLLAFGFAKERLRI